MLVVYSFSAALRATIVEVRVFLPMSAPTFEYKEVTPDWHPLRVGASSTCVIGAEMPPRVPRVGLKATRLVCMGIVSTLAAGASLADELAFKCAFGESC
jgi:hypothetical protein